MSLVSQMRGGRDYDSSWNTRMRGEGPISQLIENRFRTARKRLGLERERPSLDTGRFRVPPRDGDPMDLLAN